ncbi:MAG: hypothetical protein AAFO95_19995 [Cyanobacteria bacterium J06600_6]
MTNSSQNSIQNNIKSPKSLGQKLSSLKSKATLVAVSIGVVPMVIVGVLAHKVNSSSLKELIEEEQIEKTGLASATFADFIEDRAKELESIADNPLLSQAKYRERITIAEKVDLLDIFAKDLGYYDSLAYYDVKGNFKFQANIDTETNTPILNIGTQEHFQELIKTKKTQIDSPNLDAEKHLQIGYVVPVKEQTTGQIVGVINAQVTGLSLEKLFNVFAEPLYRTKVEEVERKRVS